MSRATTPVTLGLAGAAQIARLDRQIGVAAPLSSTWLVSSRSLDQQPPLDCLEADRARWGLENRMHHRLDVSVGEDACRVRQPQAIMVLATLRRLSVAFFVQWAKNRPARKATYRDWQSHHRASRWRVLHLVMEPLSQKK